ncbi:MAG: RIP metalloprotease RseP [Nitrospinota bacterium]
MATIFWAIVVLGALIFVHEMGHYLVARHLGIGVERFSLGFGKRLWGFRREETDYRISVIPLGGYVKLLGENPSELVAAPEPEKLFFLRPVGQRLAVVVAGPLFNIGFAILLLWVVYMVGVPVLSTTVGATSPGSPAARAGIQPGDRIVAIEGRRISRWEELAEIVHKSAGKELRITIARGAGELGLTVVPESRTVKNILGEEKRVGLIGVRAKGEFLTRRYDPLTALWRGTVRSYQIVELTVVSIYKIINRTIPSDNIGGPLRIAQIAGQSARAGLLNLAFFTAILSINLGILNLLPIPILDGGHIAFFLVEAIFRRPVSVRNREMAQRVGFVLIVALMLFAFYNDIVNIFLK